ncbi:hypothetical protein Droror1_Dr00017701 [Drosera rotundifolia]
MYAETGIFYPYIYNFSHELQQLQDLCLYQKPTSSMTSIVTEYDLGGEGDLFKAPEPIIEEPILSIDPVAAAISMMSCGDHVMPAEVLEVGDMEALQNGQRLSDVFYKCKKDVESAVLPLADAVLPHLYPMLPPLPQENVFRVEDDKLPSESSFQKSVSSGCPAEMECVKPLSARPSFLGFSEVNFEAAYRMKRSYSDGDIKTLGNGNISLVHSPTIQPHLVTRSCASEDRMKKLTRYRNKKSRRNFRRKVKYACRKALAESQPRVRGRFAKTEETDDSRKE